MNFCNCKDVAWFDVVFGVTVFLIVLYAMGNMVYDHTHWYEAIAVTLGSIIVAGGIGVISSLAAQWVIQHIVFVTISISILWALSLNIG